MRRTNPHRFPRVPTHFNTSVGKIAAGKTKTVKVKVKPRKPGRVKAPFNVTSKNAGGKTVKKGITVKK